MKLKHFTIFSILTLTLLSGCSDKESISEENMIQQNTSTKQNQATSHTFTLKSVNDKDIKVIADLNNGWKFEGINANNKLVLVDFWATWCPPCKGEIPHLNNLRKKYGKNFEILGVEIGQRSGELTPKSELQQFIKDYQIKYPVTSGGDTNMLFGGVRELNPSGSIPFMILFNTKGEYLKHYIGMVPEEMLASDIEAALKMK